MDKLAQVLQKEIPRLIFSYFSIHYIAWDLITKLKEAFTKAVSSSFHQYVPTEDQLPYVIVSILSAAGHGDTDTQECGLNKDSFFDITVAVVREFLADGKRSLIKCTSEWPVEPEGVEDIGIITGLCENTSRSRELDGLVSDERGHVPDAALVIL